MKQNRQKLFKNKSLANFFVSREEGQLKERTLTGGFAVFKLLAILSITKLYMHDITFSDICKFLVTGILICKMLFLVKWKTHWFALYLPCQTITVFSEKFFFLWNSQGDYKMNSNINWWKSLTLTWTNTSMKNFSNKVNFFTLRYFYLERFFNVSWRYRRPLKV